VHQTRGAHVLSPSGFEIPSAETSPGPHTACVRARTLTEGASCVHFRGCPRENTRAGSNQPTYHTSQFCFSGVSQAEFYGWPPALFRVARLKPTAKIRHSGNPEGRQQPHCMEQLCCSLNQ